MNGKDMGKFAFGLMTLSVLNKAWMYQAYDDYHVFVEEGDDKISQLKPQLALLGWVCIPQRSGGTIFSFRKGVE